MVDSHEKRHFVATLNNWDKRPRKAS